MLAHNTREGRKEGLGRRGKERRTVAVKRRRAKGEGVRSSKVKVWILGRRGWEAMVVTA